MNLQSKEKLLILDPTRGKLYTTKQDSAELFGQRATYILSLSDSFHYHFMSFLLKGFLQILSSLARKSRKKSIQPFLGTLLFHVMTKLESKGRRKLWPKSFAKPSVQTNMGFSMFGRTEQFGQKTEQFGRTVLPNICTNKKTKITGLLKIFFSKN